MSLTEVKHIIKNHLYIVFNENFYNESKSTFLERYVAKHPLLKPELIVVNDQLQGFKKASKKITSLEDFPIFLEIEGLKDDENCFIDSIDLYAEANVNSQKRLSDIIFLSNLYQDYVYLERVLDVSRAGDESLMITSKIQEQLMELTIDNPEDGFIELEVFIKILKNHLTIFCHIIQVLNEVIIKNADLSKVESKLGYFPEHFND
jgi:hypothetical protein